MSTPNEARPDLLVTPPSTAPEGPIDNRSLIEAVRGLMARALPPSLQDDRFEPPWPPSGLVAAVEPGGLGFLGGPLPTQPAAPWPVDGLLENPSREPARRVSALRQALVAAALTGGHERPSFIELWGRPAQDWHEQLAQDLGLSANRTLLQLRAPLPIGASSGAGEGKKPIRATLTTRSYDPERDLNALREVNNRAFAWHPDQGNQTEADLLATMAQPWFRPDGLRVADDPERPGRLIGFCWTKVHQPATEPSGGLGEIFVIGVDPDHHGKGYGAPMTAAGLDWLAALGLRTAMLYVEADNAPAVSVYQRLGFTTHRTDRSWLGPMPTDP